MSEWISVKNILPEKNKKVLTYEPQPELPMEWRWEFIVACIDDDGYWDYGFPSLGEKLEPTHWMELPTQPKD